MSDVQYRIPGVNRHKLIVCADDFGLDEAVNEAVELGSLNGILTCTSLMMGEAAVTDAIERAKRLPNLAVGLHITLTSGHAVLPKEQIPHLVDQEGRFDDNMVRAGIRYFFLPQVRKELKAEIRAQFEAFTRTGLKLDHVNTHRHFHLHPTLARMILSIGKEYGMRSMRVPYEPTISSEGRLKNGSPITFIYSTWVKSLGVYLKQAGMLVNDYVYGLKWSGSMTEKRVVYLIENLKPGLNELYLHPATKRTPQLIKLMPDYKHVLEYEALISPLIKEALKSKKIELVTYGQLAKKSL